jgi:hypothetical protein
MFQELEKIKEIFLTEEDPEELEYNKQKIIDWEKGIIASEAFLSWKDHDYSADHETSERQLQGYFPCTSTQSQSHTRAKSVLLG